jgi:hypothetical protein
LSHSTSTFLWFFFFFQDRISWTVCLGWLWTAVLLISVSWVARITGMNYWHPASYFWRWLLPELLEICSFFITCLKTCVTGNSDAPLDCLRVGACGLITRDGSYLVNPQPPLQPG